MKLKVLHIINSMTPGGAEVLLANSLSVGGLQEHTDNHLAYFMSPSYLLERIDKNVTIHFLDYKGFTDVIRLIKSIRKIIIENNIDLIHSHLAPASFYTALACPKSVYHLHTIHIAYSTDIHTRSIFKYLERKLLFDNKNSNLIFLSFFTKKDFLSTIKFKGNSYVLNNFIDDSFFIKSPVKVISRSNQELKLIAVGNLREQKNYLYLFEIFKYLQGYNITVDVYGGGDNFVSYQEIIDETNVKVNLKGPIKDIQFIIGDYDLFIMTSTNEGYPLSVFEAMAAGVPLLLSNIAPLKSIVKDNAIYFELNDAEGTAEIIKAVYDEEIDIKQLSEKAKVFAENHVRRDIYIKNLLKIYSTICK